MKPRCFPCCALLLILAACGDPERTKRKEVETGIALAKEGKTEEAEIRFRKALALDAGFADAHYQLGLSALRMGKAVEAYQELSRASELDPANRDAKVKTADLALAFFQANPASDSSSRRKVSRDN